MTYRYTSQLASNAPQNPLYAAVSYVRVSTTQQANRGGERDGFSIPAQREANSRQAHALGALVAAEFIDRGQSGRSADRPELQRMLAYLREHAVDFVIVHKIDRLARSRADDIAITEAVRASGARLVSSTENIDATPNGALLHGIMASIAEFYSRNLAQEVLKGMQQKAIQGGTPNRAPIGYLNVRATAEDGREYRTVRVDPERAPHIVWAFETYATGTWSVAQLVVALDKRGLRTRRTKAKEPSPLVLSAVHRTLTNPYYKGVVTLNGAQHAGAHEAIVTPELWDRVQRLLASRKQGERSRIHTHYLKSTVRCFNCHRRLVVHKARSHSGRVYDYFVCCGRQSGTPLCTQRALRIDAAEQRIEDAYRSIQISPEQRAFIEQRYRERVAGETLNREHMREDLREQQRAIQGRQEKLLDVYYSDALPRDLFLKEQRKLNDTLGKVRRELQSYDEDDSLRLKRAIEVLDLLEGCHARYLESSSPDRKIMNNTLLAHILISPITDEIHVELRPEIAQLLSIEDVSSPFA